MKVLVGFVVGVIVGAIAGAIGAVVFAGESDQDLREVYRTVRKNVEDLDVDEVTTQVQENIAEVGAQVQAQMTEIQSQVQDKIAEMMVKSEDGGNGKAERGTAPTEA